MIKISNIIKKFININCVLILLISIFQICTVYVIIRNSLPKLVIIIFIIPLIMYNFHLNNLIKNIKPTFNNRKSKNIFYLIIIILSLVFYKSINLQILFVNEGIMSIPYIIGMFLWYVQFVLILTCMLEKINIPRITFNKKYYILLYAIPSLIVFVLVYFIYFPGLCSADSIYIWTEVGNNVYSDAHPIVYMFLIKLLRLIWNDIAVVGLFQIILCSFTFGFVVNEMDSIGAPKWLCWSIAVIIPLIPANAMYTITFWKDTPYTIGLLILSILLFRCVTSNYYYNKKAFPQIFFVSLFTLFMRHNALLSVMLSLFILGIFYIFKKDKRLIVKTLILGASLMVAFFGIKAALFNVLASSNTNAEYTGKTFSFRVPVTIPTQQIIYTEHVAGTSFTQEEKKLFKEFYNIKGLEKHKEKYKENNIWQYYHKPEKTTNFYTINQDPTKFWRYYFNLWMRFPKSMLGGYERITSINWASSSYGSVAYRGTVTCNIKGLDSYIYRPIIKGGMNYKLDKSIFAYKESSLALIFWRPALAFIFMLLLMYVAVRKHGIGAMFLALPVILNQLTYFIITASQDTRYTYINYTMFIIMLVLAMLDSSKNKEHNS